ncbi:store-operated calcium entry-associated regulatory factor-like [Diadema antillarum]|uniref:store-operated calcium entry-associated regulatory factor-like n=1 Tax=Diadema antillarum TaxID=105358 RepID=UPI003A8C25C6
MLTCRATMKFFVQCSIFFFCLLLFLDTSFVSGAFGFGKSDRVRLEDVSVLTLHNGKMTAARRSSPVPQLKCVGGTAGCHEFTPQVVQCYNRGSDGYDVQWECKTDMDNAYRFGQIEVTCEGYSSPDDDYVLKGSCGLEYTLDYTKEGMQQNKYGHQHSYYGSEDNSYNLYKSKKKSGGTDWVFLAIVGVMIYVMYRTCIADSHNSASQSGSGSDDGYPGPRGSGFGPGGGGGPPPPGFRSDNYPGDSCSGSQGYSQGYSQGTYRAPGTGGGGVGGGGFWTGAAAGGLLGYLFGNRNRGYGGYGGYGGYTRPHRGFFSTPRHSSGFSSGWGGSGGGFSGGGSTGTRTASGFGGTRRR